jgi:hypothetical protein
LTSIAIIEALAQITGVNCPVSMFLGDIRSSSGYPDRVENFLPSVKTSVDVNPGLLKALEEGRAKKSSKDLTESPLTAFVYRCLGHKGTLFALQQSKLMFAGELQAFDFLKGLDRDMINATINACAQIAISRREALISFQKMLRNEDEIFR